MEICHFGFENWPIIEDGVGFSRWGGQGCALSAPLDQNPLPVLKLVVVVQNADNVHPCNVQEVDFATSDLKIGQ
jgi:hypothetical protein